MPGMRMFDNAAVTRVIGPDMFEVMVDVGFDITHRRRLKLAGVDSEHARTLDQNAQRKAIEFLRSRIEGKSVTLRVMRKGEHYYAKVLYGSDSTDVLDEMVTLGLLRKFERVDENGD